MPHEPTPNPPTIYQIRIEGRLGRLRARSFEGMTVARDEAGGTLLTGPVADQAALHGLIRKLRDLGLTLLDVHRLESASGDPERNEQP